MEACARPRPLPPTNGRDSPRRLNCLTDLQTTGYPGDYVTSNVTKEAPCRIEIRIALVICVIHSQQLKCFENCLFKPRREKRGYNFDANVCLWDRSSQADGPISMRFF